MAKAALLIGVSAYENGLSPLPAAVKDVEAMRQALQDPETGGFNLVKTLANPDHATMQYEVETLFTDRAKDDLVLLYFSGHGVKDNIGNLYFAARNTQKSPKNELIKSTAVPARFVHDILNNSRARRQAVILDCCFSGAFDPALVAKDDGSVDLQSQLGAEGRVVLTSSSSTQYSFEHQDFDLSIYTRYLVEGLETGAGDLNQDGQVSMLELHDYASSRVQETAPGMTPKIIVLKEKGFEIVLGKAKVTDPKLRYRREAQKYVYEGDISPIGRRILDRLREQLALEAEVTDRIEKEVVLPSRERLRNLQEYRSALMMAAEHCFPLQEPFLGQLQDLQQVLALRDEDVEPIRQEVIGRFKHLQESRQQKQKQYGDKVAQALLLKYPLDQPAMERLEKVKQQLGLSDGEALEVEKTLLAQAEVRYLTQSEQEEANRARQRQAERRQQEWEEYRRNLRLYESRFAEEIKNDFPLKYYVEEELLSLRQAMGLKEKDVELVERPLRDQAEERMRQKQEKERQEAGDQNKKRYEQAFARALKIAYPLLPPEKERLRKIQQTLGLTDTEVSRLEKPHLDEAKRLNIPNPPERRREPTIQHPPEPSGSGVPANYLIPSVVLTVLSLVSASYLNIILGGIAIYYAFQVKSRYQANNVPGAQKAAHLVKWLCIAIAVILFLVLLLNIFGYLLLDDSFYLEDLFLE